MNKQLKVTEIIKSIDPQSGEEIEYIAKYNSVEKAKKVNDRTLEFIISDEKIDRDKDKIIQDGWKLTEYRKAPIVLQNHLRTGTAKSVAKTTKIWVDKNTKQLKANIKFPTPEESSEGDSLYKLYKGGYMFGVSPGFIPNRDKMIFGQKEKDPRVTYGEVILYEISLVTIPSNPRALVQLKSLDGVKQALADGVVDELEINDLEMFIVKNIDDKKNHIVEKDHNDKDIDKDIKNKTFEDDEQTDLKNKNLKNDINNNDFHDDHSGRDSESEILANSYLTIDSDNLEKVKFKIGEKQMDKDKDKKDTKIEFNMDELIDKIEKRFEEKKKAEDEAARIKALEDENAKLKKENEVITKSPAFDMTKFKQFANAKEGDDSNFEVGEPDKFMGFNFKSQGETYLKNTKLDLTEKQESEAKRYVISKFARYSRDEEIQKSALINTTSYSGVVPAEWYDQILLKAQEGSYFGRCRPFELGPSKTMHISPEGAGVTLTYAGEGAQLTTASPSAGDTTVQAKKYGFSGNLTYEALESANTDIYGYLTYMGIKAHREGLDNLIFNGDSYAFTGILGNATTSVTFGLNNAAPSFNSMVAANWRDLIYSLTQGQRVGAELYMGKGLRSVLESLPTVNTALSGSANLFINPANPDKLMGYQINESEQITDTNASSTVFACFGNLFYYALAMAPSNEGLVVNPYGGETEFNQDKILWKYRIWAAGKMIHAGHFADIGTQ